MKMSKTTRYGTVPKGAIVIKDMMTGVGRSRNQAVLLWRFVDGV